MWWLSWHRLVVVMVQTVVANMANSLVAVMTKLGCPHDPSCGGWGGGIPYLLSGGPTFPITGPVHFFGSKENINNSCLSPSCSRSPILDETRWQRHARSENRWEMELIILLNNCERNSHIWWRDYSAAGCRGRDFKFFERGIIHWRDDLRKERSTAVVMINW